MIIMTISDQIFENIMIFCDKKFWIIDHVAGSITTTKSNFKDLEHQNSRIFKDQLIFGPIFKDGNRKVQVHYGRTLSPVNEPDTPTITQIWVHANKGTLYH